MRAIEVSQTLNVRKEHQGDEVQGRDVGEIPFHVRQDEETERVCHRRRAEKYFLSLRPTRDDLVYPVGQSPERWTTWIGPETNHLVRDAGNASIYGLTMRSYNAGVSRKMWVCCLEYCTEKFHDSALDAIMGRSSKLTLRM
jgi:hypothetical protein